MPEKHQPELRKCRLSSLICNLYRQPQLRIRCLNLALRCEGGQFYSETTRNILAKYHGVKVGAYSYGECLIPGSFPPGVTVGRYVSIASQVRAFVRNHPLERLSMHPFFYNSKLGFLEKDSILSTELNIESDSWLGHGVLIMPGCNRVGIGAVIGAGSVVTKDVPDFAVVAGNPARLIRYRFSESARETILASRWWERPVWECVRDMKSMITPLPEELGKHPLLSLAAKSRRTSARGADDRKSASGPDVQN